MIKFAQQLSVNNLCIPFAGFDLVPNLYKGLISRYCNGKQARVWAEDPWWQGEERKRLCGSQIGLKTSVRSDKQTGILRNVTENLNQWPLSCLFQVSTSNLFPLVPTLCLWQAG